LCAPQFAVLPGAPVAGLLSRINATVQPRPAEASGPPAPPIAWIPVAFTVFWTFVGLAFAGQLYLTQAKLGSPVTWRFAVTRSLADWYAFAVLSLPAIAFARRFPLGSAPLRLLAIVHLVASLVFSLVWMLLRAGIAVRLEHKPFAETLRHALVATLFFNLLVYWVVVAVTHAVGFYRSLRERERRTLELEKHVTEARLLALQMQLNPHFLFNALHGVSALMYRDVDAADRMLVKLGDLLRHALARSDAQRVPLRDELAFLDRYLELEQIRFDGRLSVCSEISDAARDALVPNLILQPLVENALKHGIEPQVKPGVITLRATILDGRLLRLEVEDNGRGLAPGKSAEGGIGTANSRARLAQLYGRRGQINFLPGEDGGLRVMMEIPFER
jgi:two-component system, LytTR family, sensor kinase